jgi:hypothetical protein
MSGLLGTGNDATGLAEWEACEVISAGWLGSVDSRAAGQAGNGRCCKCTVPGWSPVAASAQTDAAPDCRHPVGPLFSNADGNPWNLQTINCRFRRKRNRKRDPLDKDITAYVYQGTWATDALEAGVPDAAVDAELTLVNVILNGRIGDVHERLQVLRLINRAGRQGSFGYFAWSKWDNISGAHSDAAIAEASRVV